MNELSALTEASTQRRHNWQSAGEWAVVFALLSLGVVSIMSIGYAVLAGALILLVIVRRRNRAWPEALIGGLVGTGATCLFIAYLHRDDSPCPPGPVHMVVHRGDFGSCGGFDPTPWLVTGLVLAVSGIVAYLILKRILVATEPR